MRRPDIAKKIWSSCDLPIDFKARIYTFALFTKNDKIIDGGWGILIKIIPEEQTGTKHLCDCFSDRFPS